MADVNMIHRPDPCIADALADLNFCCLVFYCICFIYLFIVSEY